MCYKNSKQNKILVFDSFGQPPRGAIRDFCARHASRIEFNRGKHQKDSEITCAAYCAYVIHQLAKGRSFPSIIRTFLAVKHDDRYVRKHLRDVFSIDLPLVWVLSSRMVASNKAAVQKVSSDIIGKVVDNVIAAKPKRRQGSRRPATHPIFAIQFFKKGSGYQIKLVNIKCSEHVERSDTETDWFLEAFIEKPFTFKTC